MPIITVQNNICMYNSCSKDNIVYNHNIYHIRVKEYVTIFSLWFFFLSYSNSRCNICDSIQNVQSLYKNIIMVQRYRVCILFYFIFFSRRHWPKRKKKETENNHNELYVTFSLWTYSKCVYRLLSIRNNNIKKKWHTFILFLL